MWQLRISILRNMLYISLHRRQYAINQLHVRAVSSGLLRNKALSLCNKIFAVYKSANIILFEPNKKKRNGSDMSWDILKLNFESHFYPASVYLPTYQQWVSARPNYASVPLAFPMHLIHTLSSIQAEIITSSSKHWSAASPVVRNRNTPPKPLPVGAASIRIWRGPPFNQGTGTKAASSPWLQSPLNVAQCTVYLISDLWSSNLDLFSLLTPKEYDSSQAVQYILSSSVHPNSIQSLFSPALVTPSGIPWSFDNGGRVLAAWKIIPHFIISAPLRGIASNIAHSSACQ